MEKIPVLKVGRKTIIKRETLEEFILLNENNNLRVEDEVVPVLHNVEAVERGWEWRAKRRTTAERLDNLTEKMNQYEAQKKQLEKRLAEEQRKARTKRLIEIGASVESVYGKPIENEKLLNLINFLNEQENRGNYFSKALERNIETKETEWNM